MTFLICIIIFKIIASNERYRAKNQLYEWYCNKDWWDNPKQKEYILKLMDNIDIYIKILFGFLMQLTGLFILTNL